MFVYVLKHPVDHLRKIGITHNLTQRLEAISRIESAAISLEWSKPASNRRDAASIERRAHNAIAGVRVRGEWFKCSTAMAILAIENPRKAMMVSPPLIVERFGGIAAKRCPNGGSCFKADCSHICITTLPDDYIDETIPPLSGPWARPPAPPPISDRLKAAILHRHASGKTPEQIQKALRTTLGEEVELVKVLEVIGAG